MTNNCLSLHAWCGVALAATLCAGCGDPPPPTEGPARPVKMMTLDDAHAAANLEYPGEIRAMQRVELGFEVPGRIIELPIEDGMEVQQGALLAKLDPRDYLTARDRAAANRDAMRSAYQRARNIFEEGAGSQAEVDRTLRDYQVAEEDLKTAQKALDDTELLAEFSGQVARKLVENFENVQAKEPVLHLQDVSGLELDVAVPEVDFVRVKPGDSPEQISARFEAEVSVSSIPGRAFPARVKSFTTEADPVTRTYKVTFSFDNPPDVNILPGMTARISITADPELVALHKGEFDGFTVPVEATAIAADGSAYVWRIDETSMTAVKTGVELGEMVGGRVRVASGLSPGDTIAVAGAAYLHDGMKVRRLGE